MVCVTHLLQLLPLLPVLAPPPTHAKFYIGRYKTVLQHTEAANDAGHASNLPYMMHPDEAEGKMAVNRRINKEGRAQTPPWWNTRPAPHHHNFRPPTMFGFYPNNYGNQNNGYSGLQNNDIKYVVPPFTPGGYVHVALQFWIPISIGGFLVSSRDLTTAFKSPNPTAYITKLFLKHLTTNSSDILGGLEGPLVEKGVQNFLDWVLPYLDHFTGRDINTIEAFKFSDVDENKLNSRQKRSSEDSEDGWVTIGEEQTTATPTAPLLSHGSSSLGPAGQGHNDRVLWGGGHLLSHNDILNSDDKVTPSLDFGAPIDTRRYPRPRPSFSHPASYHPYSSSYPPSSDYPSSSDISPPFQLTSFDDIPSGGTGAKRDLDVSTRLSRLDYLFTNLHLDHEECRRRVLCEVSREPDTFDPLSGMINGETRFPGDAQELSRTLLRTAEGARLLSYIEAVKTGEDRSQECDVYRYRCRMRAREVINTDILPIWREVVRWLTVKVLTQDTSLR
ncbi:uncharacterized protein [Procambarus clarkii]|uniref:uncharacterized protein isoform X1 n=1 Tax=Procambarus clarkii TaxID=6728 RepID=UPI00374211E6